MSSSSSRAVSMMIGTRAGGAEPLADLEAVEPWQHDVEHHQVDRGVREAAQRLLAVGRLHDRVPVLLEREREHLADGVLIVDEQDRGSRFGHGGRPAARIALAMALARTPARRRRARRGSLERPINARLYRSSLARSLAAAPDPRLQHHAAGRAAGAAAAAELRRGGDTAAGDGLLEPLPGPRPGRAGLADRRAVVPRPARTVRPAGHDGQLAGGCAGPRTGAPPQSLGRRAAGSPPMRSS